MNIIDKFNIWRRKIRWNKQYKKGRWDNLKNDTEAIRYNAIIKQFSFLDPSIKPAILDLGAGEGILNERIEANFYSFFKGVDFSSVSIKKAKQKKLVNSEYVVADLHTFTPKKMYDIIVFNEAFYYLHQSEKANTLDRICNYLNPDGILIVSMFREAVTSWGHFKDNSTLKELDFKTVTTSEDNKYWKIGTYKKHI